MEKNNISMARAMFNYTKTILEKVSFSTELFLIELEKGLKKLLPYEVFELKVWLENLTKEKPELKSSLLLIEHKKKSF